MVKVGYKVQIDETVSSYYGRCGIVTHDDACETYPYTVKFDDGDDCIFKGSDLIVLSTEEETSMKFKVGDKVKVSNSWEGNSGKTGTVVKVTFCEPYAYRINFEDASPESFKEKELELVKEKSFTKSDLKTGMGVVLRNGDRMHVLKGCEKKDIIKNTEKGDLWGYLSSYTDDLKFENHQELDIIRVYQSEFEYETLTKGVFEGDLIYERQEPVKMTMKEINEHFGKAIEIVE